MEKWYKIKDFKDTNNVYEVSDKGNVKKGEKILKLTPNKRGGYWCVTLYSTISQKGYFTMVHSLMKRYIFKVADNKIMINHKDGDKKNNALSNLELSYALHNTHHAIDAGLFYADKITIEKINQIRNFIIQNKSKYTYKMLSEIFNLKTTTIRRIIKGTVRKTLVLENLEKLVLLQKNKIESNLKEIIKDLTENKKTINFVAKKFKHDHQTIKTIANNYSSKKLTSTTIENINVTSKEE
jgi:hypothetical protein